MDNLEPEDRRRLLKIRWPELSDEHFERLCEVWERGAPPRWLPKKSAEKPPHWSPPEFSLADFSEALDLGPGPGL